MIERLPWNNLQRFHRLSPKDETRLVASDGDWADTLGTSRQQIIRYRRDGLPWYLADRIACRVVGVHPANIWPEWFAND